MPRDHLVKSVGEDTIADLTYTLRERLHIVDQVPLDIVWVLERLNGLRFGRKGPLHLRIYSKNLDENDANVTFSPLTMNLDEELWRYAKHGDPWSRFVLAHEIGHVVLHDLNAKAFSGKDSGFGIFGVNEVSAEWQANAFAGHLLIPNSIASVANSAEELAFLANVEIRRAQERLEYVKKQRLWRQIPKQYSGEPCLSCANFTLVRSGMTEKCEICGAQTIPY